MTFCQKNKDLFQNVRFGILNLNGKACQCSFTIVTLVSIRLGFGNKRKLLAVQVLKLVCEQRDKGLQS